MKKSIIYLAFICLGLNVNAQTEFPNPSIKIETVPADVVYFIASDNGSNTLMPHYTGFDTSNTSANGTITLNPDNKFQQIEGFGFAITGSTAYNLLKMPEANRKALLMQVFSPAVGYGCNYVRVPIGCSDFSLSEFTCCDTKGIDNFALTDEYTKYIIPVLKEIVKINPDLKVISAPWTSPLWMKNNGEWKGGNLETKYYKDYATYFVKWIQAMKENGIKITAVTPQNEPLNWHNSASMFMNWWEQRDFIKQALGPAFKEAGLDTQIYCYDHNYNYDNDEPQIHYPVKIYEDKDAAKYITGAAFHNYGGNASEMTYVHNLYPDKDLLFTEWSAGSWSHPGVGMEGITTDARALLFDVIRNWGKGSIVWNLLLDSEHGPKRPGGAQDANGAVDVSSADYTSLAYNSFYYVICAAAAAVDNDTQYIGSTGTVSGIESLAFKTSKGHSVILMNTSEQEKKVRVNDGSHSFIANIPAKSLATYRW